eukprot:6207806-Pleurochrysis_carterae.AAC.3
MKNSDDAFSAQLHNISCRRSEHHGNPLAMHGKQGAASQPKSQRHCTSGIALGHRSTPAVTLDGASIYQN